MSHTKRIYNRMPVGRPARRHCGCYSRFYHPYRTMKCGHKRKKYGCCDYRWGLAKYSRADQKTYIRETINIESHGYREPCSLFDDLPDRYGLLRLRGRQVDETIQGVNPVLKREQNKKLVFEYKFRCECGKEWSVTGNTVEKDQKCPKCSKVHRSNSWYDQKDVRTTPARA